MIRSKNNFFKTSDGTNIYFEDYGKGQPILMLPGFLCTTKFFSRNIDTLSKNNRFIVLDTRGHGSSDKTLQNLTIERCAHDVKELIDHLDLQDVFLIGWSLGGTIAMSYWQQFNKYKLCALGITDSPLYPFSPEDWNSHSLKGFNMDALNGVIAKATDNYVDYCNNFAKSLWKTPPSADDLAWIVEEARKTPPWIAFALYSNYVHRDSVSILPTLTIPTVVFGGDSGILPSGSNMAKAYMQYIKAPSELHIFEQGGHMFFYTEAEKYNQVLLDFLAKYSK